MFGKNKIIQSLQQENENYSQVMDALNRSLATIEFNLKGKILTANANFLNTVGYSLDEIVGQHHSLFVTEKYKRSAEYADFWQKLASGEFFSGQFLRIGKGGKEIWIEATYNPIKDKNGKAYKVIKLASDITEKVQLELDEAAKLAAIDTSYAVIEFKPDGTVISANQNFADTLGYTREELVGIHHRTFMDKEESNGEAYKHFWSDLAAGKKNSGRFRRVDKSGNDVWIQAAYIPVHIDGKPPHKVIKIAANITEQKMLEMNIDSIIKEATNILLSVSNGNLTHFIEKNYTGNLDQLKQNLNSTIGKLSAALTDISTSVNSVSSSASEVSDAANNLSMKVQETALSAEQASQVINSTLTQVSATKEKVGEVKGLSHDQQTLIDTGSSLMDETLTAMRQISTSSEEITNIVSLIDGIAFQTNLLALNAAVEAARAGDHGRGFAVVAGEVRNLAQKSANAAKDIKVLIEQSVKQAGAGVDVVGKLSDNLNAIRDKSTEVSQTVELVDNLAEQQAQSMNQIEKEVSVIEAAAQENAASVEQASATAESLESQADDVKTIINGFTLSENNRLPSR